MKIILRFSFVLLLWTFSTMADIARNEVDIAMNATFIASNASDIADNVIAINGNTDLISTNASGIVANEILIGENAADILNNANAIVELSNENQVISNRMNTIEIDMGDLAVGLNTVSNGLISTIDNTLDTKAVAITQILRDSFVDAINNSETPLEFSEEGLASLGINSNGVEGVISRSENGAIHIGENSLVTIEANGVQQLYATDANTNAIDIDITNGSDLLINGVSVSDSLTANNGNIGANSNSIAVNVGAIAANVANVTANSNSIVAEADARIAADTTLQGNIDAEATARSNVDFTLQSNITAEQIARIAADATLQLNIDAEETARIAADAADQYARISADNNLQNQIDGLNLDSGSGGSNSDSSDALLSLLIEKIDKLEESVTTLSNALSSAIADEKDARIEEDQQLEFKLNLSLSYQDMTRMLAINSLSNSLADANAALAEDFEASERAIEALQIQMTNINFQVAQTNLMSIEQAKGMMRDLRAGSQTIDVSNGMATVRMMLEESTDLTTNWTRRSEMMEIEIPATNDVQFFRFRMQ